MSVVRSIHLSGNGERRTENGTMRNVAVDDLRQQLRERGYLSHGIERWFALDPWRSRAFWIELLVVSGKAATLIGAFALLPLVAIMLFRNHPLTAWETLLMAIVYGGSAIIISFAISAALLSFSIYELQRVPAIHQRSRGVPMSIAASILTALLFLPAYAAQERRTAEPPIQVVTAPTSKRIAVVAVDGLTFE